MKNTIPKFACLVALAVALAGCGSGDPKTSTPETTTTTTGGATTTTSGNAGTPATTENVMVGAWKLVLSKETLAAAPKGAKPPEMTFNFKADNTFEGALDMGGTKSTATGDYKLDGKKLTITFKMEDGKPSKTPPATVDLADDMKSFPMPGGPPGQPAPGNLVKQ